MRKWALLVMLAMALSSPCSNASDCTPTNWQLPNGTPLYVPALHMNNCKVRLTSAITSASTYSAYNINTDFWTNYKNGSPRWVNESNCQFVLTGDLNVPVTLVDEEHWSGQDDAVGYVTMRWIPG